MQTRGEIAPGHPSRPQRRQQRDVLRAARRLAIPPELTHVELPGHRQEPVLVVRVAVGQHHPVEPHDAPLLEPWQDRQLANAAIVAHLATAIDQRTRAVVAFQQR